MEKTVLVAGGAGYIGSHFCARLADLNYRYIVLDDLSRGTRGSVPANVLVEGSIQDGALVRRLVAEYEVDVAVHFAAYAYVGESMTDPQLYYENNLANTIHFVSALRAAGVRAFVFSSTCATYGTPQEPKPITEDLPQNPINPYGETKLAVEHLLRDYDRAYGLRFAALRYFNAAGCSETHDLYEGHDPETHLLPLAIEAAVGDRELVVYGDDHPTPDGTCIRDYIHVDDLADAHIAAIDRLRNGSASMQLNLGVGLGVSVREVIEAVGRVTGVPVKYRVGPKREGDPPVLVAASHRAQDLLGWKPRYTIFDDTVRTAVLGYKRARCLPAR